MAKTKKPKKPVPKPTPLNLSALETLMVKAKTNIIIDQPFVASLLLGLKFVASDRVPTAGTDGKRFLYNPEFMGTLSPKPLEGVMAHEVWHVALHHCTRRGSRDPVKWNVAADYKTNQMLVAAGYTLPDGALLDSQYDNVTTERCYDLLPDEDFEMPTFGLVLDATNPDGSQMDQAQKDSFEHQVTLDVTKAIQNAKAAGKVPGGLNDWMDNFNEPKVAYHELLRRKLITRGTTERTWKKPSKRYVGGGVYLPSRQGRTIPEIICIADTSGSMGPAEKAQVGGEISSIVEDLKATVTVLYVDHNLAGVSDKYTLEDLPLKLNFKGGGGTSFRPGFKWIEDQGLEPFAVLYFTDLCCSDYPDEPPSYPVYWLTTEEDTSYRDNPPFGEIITIDWKD